MIWLLQISLYTYSLLAAVSLTSVCFVLLHLLSITIWPLFTNMILGNQVAKHTKYQIFRFANDLSLALYTHSLCGGAWPHHWTRSRFSFKL